LAAAKNVESANVPLYGSWLNRIEAQFTALRYFTLDGTDHEPHHEEASMIRRYMAGRNRHVAGPMLRGVIRRAETIKKAKGLTRHEFEVNAAGLKGLLTLNLSGLILLRARDLTAERPRTLEGS
jgi:hypothetical protein